MNNAPDTIQIRDSHTDPELFNAWLHRYSDALAVTATIELAAMLRKEIDAMGAPANAVERNQRAGLATAAAWLDGIAAMKERGPNHETAEMLFVSSFEETK